MDEKLRFVFEYEHDGVASVSNRLSLELSTNSKANPPGGASRKPFRTTGHLRVTFSGHFLPKEFHDTNFPISITGVEL